MKFQTALWNGGVLVDYLVFNEGKYIGVLTPELFSLMCNPLTGAPRGAKPTKEYQYAFIYNRLPVIPNGNWANKRWWRTDGTPCTNEEIPKDYLAMVLILT